MTKDELLEEASMMKILMDHGPREEGPSGRKHGDEGFSRSATCVVTAVETQTLSAPQMESVACLGGGHGGCHGPPQSGFQHLDSNLFNNGTVASVKMKGKQIVDCVGQYQMAHMQLGQTGIGFAMSHEG